jgi:hypothetical protein
MTGMPSIREHFSAFCGGWRIWRAAGAGRNCGRCRQKLPVRR